MKNLKNRRHSKIMLFFHGNAEDIGIARRTLNGLRASLKISIFAIEYSGYGLFVGEKNADKILVDCLQIYDYIINELGVAQEDILLFGRSLGSSPSCYIAEQRPKVGSLILMSPFKSLREVAKDHVGKILSYLLAERYRNVDLIQNVKCPVLMIHGKDDNTIGVQHSIALKNSCGSSICKLVIRDKMDHNSFNFQEDLILPLKTFLKENKIRLHKIKPETKQFFRISPELYKVPNNI